MACRNLSESERGGPVAFALLRQRDADMAGELLARNGPGAVIPGFGAQFDLSAVVAERQPVAPHGGDSPERIVVGQRGMIGGDGDAAAGILDDDRPVEFPEKVVGGDESPDGDILRDGDAGAAVAERFQVGDGVLRRFGRLGESGFRGFVAPGQQQ